MSASAGTTSEAGGTTGARLGMDGADWRVALRTYAAFAFLLLFFDTANVFSAVQERATAGHPIPLIEPVIWETSSAIGFLLFAPVVYLAARLAPPGRGRWLRFALVHPPASVLFSVLHVLTMGLVRTGVYVLLTGSPYTGQLFDFLYEYRKDVPGYIIIAGLVWLLGALERASPPKPLAESPGADMVLDIKDGARLIRSRVADIVAVTSAGNYVEVVLADGRRPLMRSTLAAAESRLAPHGFVRTHRSWLINAARVRELTAVGSGDFTLQLEGGAEAPLSRRFPAALERLRSGSIRSE
jgi:hypothetical protein